MSRYRASGRDDVAAGYRHGELLYGPFGVLRVPGPAYSKIQRLGGVLE